MTGQLGSSRVDEAVEKVEASASDALFPLMHTPVNARSISLQFTFPSVTGFYAPLIQERRQDFPDRLWSQLEEIMVATDAFEELQRDRRVWIRDYIRLKSCEHEFSERRRGVGGIVEFVVWRTRGFADFFDWYVEERSGAYRCFLC
jgi:hypothetical protein